MPSYVLSERAYINDRLVEPGETVLVGDAFVPGPHMEPARDEKGREDKAARAAKDAAAERAKMPRPGDPAYIGTMIDHNVNDGATKGQVKVESAHPDTPGLLVDDTGQVRGVTSGDRPPEG